MIWLLGGYMWLFIHRPFEVWPVLGTLRIERMVMLATLTCWLLTLDRSWIRNRLNVAFAAFAVALLAAWLASSHADLGTSTVEDWFKVAIFYVIFLSTVRTERDLMRTVVMYVGAVGLYMAHSLWEYHNGRFQWTMGTSRLLGIDETYGDPNTFAATIIYSLPIAMVLWKVSRARWQQAILACYTLLSVACVFLTSSRTGFVGLSFLVLVAAMRSEHRLRWIAVLVIAAPLAWVSLPQDRQNRFLTLIDSSYGPENALESAEGTREGLVRRSSAVERESGFRRRPRRFRRRDRHGIPIAPALRASPGRTGHGRRGGVRHGALAFACNALEARRWCAVWPELADGFTPELVRGTTLAVVLMLLMGLAGHNLFRYTWLWFGAFQAAALFCMNQREQQLADADDSAVREHLEVACT